MTLAEIDNLTGEELEAKFDELSKKLKDTEIDCDRYKAYYETLQDDMETQKAYCNELEIKNRLLRDMLNSVIQNI